MGMSISKILSSPQTYNWLAQLGGAISPEGSAGQRVGDAAQGITAAQIEQEARKKAEKTAKRKRRQGAVVKLGTTLLGSAVGGPAGAAVGSAVGNAAVPATPAATGETTTKSAKFAAQNMLDPLEEEEGKSRWMADLIRSLGSYYQ